MERTNRLVSDKFFGSLLSTLGMVGSIAIASIVDRIMVGNLLGSKALAALSLNSPVICIINIIFSFFVFGGNTLAVTLKAERDREGANKAFTISILVGAAFMGIIALLGIIFKAQIAAGLCRNESQLLQPVIDYLVPLLILGVLIIPANGTCSFVRMDGMQRLAFIIPVVSNAVNLLFDYLFMGILHLGITSAGWATNIGYIAGMLCLLAYFKSEKRSFFFAPLKVSDLSLLREILKTGLASALVDACLFVQSLTTNLIIVATYGAVGAEVAAVCLSAQSIVGILYNGTTQTMLPIGGALYGEKDYTGMRSVMRSGFIVTEGLILAAVSILWIFVRGFGAVFGVRSDEAVDLLQTAFRMYLISLPLVGVQECLRVVLQATKRKNVASVMTGLSGTVCFVPVILVMSMAFPAYIWLSFAIASLITICGCFIYLRIKEKGVLIPAGEKEDMSFEFSIKNTINDAEQISVKMIELCKKNGLGDRIANLMGVAVEEMCTNIAKYAYTGSEGSADIFLRLEGDVLLLRIRDNGVLFNPVEFVDDRGIEITGLQVLRKLPVNVEYNRVLGFNNTIVTVNI